jgi:simple sugar transport system permease protein
MMVKGKIIAGIGLSVFMGIIGGLILLLSANTQGLTSTFVTTSQRAGISIVGPDIVLSTHTTLLVFASLSILLGVIHILGIVKKRGEALIIVSVVLAIFAFLIWATKGKSINLTGMFVSSIVRATPICLAALAGIYSERSGVTNIGIEGMMLVSAFLSVVMTSVTKSLIVGVVFGMLAGALLAWLHAVLSIRYKVNQIISGTAIIIFALGLTSYLQRAVLNVYRHLNNPGAVITAFQIPYLWKIPFFGPVLFNQSPIIYAMFFLIIIRFVIFNYTKWGLRVRSVGEHPKAADTLGISVLKIRYISVLISGLIAGLAGAYISIGSVGRFNEGMTAGKGFLGMAAMIFGNWNPGGAFLGSFIFGFFDSWQDKLSILQIGVPVELLGMAPYIATMVVLSGFIGRSRPPAAGGIPYEKQ